MDIKVVTMCGSMRFSKQMITIASNLEKEYGWCVIQCVYDIDPNKLSDEEADKIVNAHWKKIDISDAIYVVNIDGYIGKSTHNEIDYAMKNGKQIIYHEK